MQPSKERKKFYRKLGRGLIPAATTPSSDRLPLDLPLIRVGSREIVKLDLYSAFLKKQKNPKN